jgi:ribonuclease HI
MNSDIEIYIRQDGTQIVNVNVGGMVVAKPAHEWVELAYEIMKEICLQQSAPSFTVERTVVTAETDKTISEMKIKSVYADGGVIGSNPSAIGGTYAYRLIEEDGQLGHYIDGAFVLTARENGGPVTNNQTEMLAVLSALELVPDDWAGILYSDSQVTLGRVFMGWKWANVPQFMHEKYKAIRARLTHFEDIRFTLLDGHPTKAQLQAGKGKRGGPVSEHNVWCDHACTGAGEKYLAEVGELVKELSSVEL